MTSGWKSPTIRTQKDLEGAVSSFGILPLFKNAIPGFSVEEHADPSVWFSGEEGVWEWKGPVIRNLHCAYGKFLGNKAVFISKEWFPDFANWRRDGYDFDARFDDELASWQDKRLFELTDKMAPVLSGDLKKEGNYRKGGNGGFEGIMTRLQSQGYILITDFVYKEDRYGRKFGWGVAQYSTPEKFFGEEFTKNVYRREPMESYRRIYDHLTGMFPDCDPKTVERFLNKNTGVSRPSGRKNWLVPSNPKYYDVIAAFEAEEEILWKQGNDNMRPGDIVYLYLGLPYSAILYRCEITETDIPYTGINEHVHLTKLMSIRRLEAYPRDLLTLARLKEYDVVTVRCARGMPDRLAHDIEEGLFSSGANQ